MILLRIFDHNLEHGALDAVITRSSAAAAVPSSALLATLVLRPTAYKHFLLDRRAGHNGRVRVDFGEGSANCCPDHDCRLSRCITGCAVAVDLVSLFSRLSPTATFETQHGLGCRTHMQLTAVVLCVSNQSLHEQLGLYRCFSALLNSLQAKVAVYLLHARPVHAATNHVATLHEQGFCARALCCCGHLPVSSLLALLCPIVGLSLLSDRAEICFAAALLLRCLTVALRCVLADVIFNRHVLLRIKRRHAIQDYLRLAGATARPSDDLISAPAVETTSTGRHLTQSPAGPASAGCADAGVSCCYSPTW